MIPILFEPKYRLGQKVRSAINETFEYFVISYHIYMVNADGTVAIFSYGCSDASGLTCYMKEFEIEELEPSTR